MAIQPSALNEVEETSKTIPFTDCMSPHEIAEILRQDDLQSRLHPVLVQSFNMIKLDDNNNNNLHGKDSQSIASMPSRFPVNSCQDQYDAVIKTRSADFTTSNMMQLSQQALELNEISHAPSQSSEKTLKKMVDLPQPLIDFNNLRTSTSFSKFLDDKIKELSKAPMMLAPGEIPQSSNNFKKACIAHLPSKMDLNEETHNDINQETSDKPSYFSANSDSQQEIHRDIQIYHRVKLIGGYYSSIELNKELLNVDTISLDESKPQVPPHEQEHSDMMWLQSAWSRGTEALSVGKVWTGMNSEQKAAFDRAIIYRAQHKELTSSSLRLQIDKFTARILFVTEGLQAPACSPTIVDLKNILRGAQSFNTLSHEKCNMLMAAQRRHNKHDLIDSLESEASRSASRNVRSIQSTQLDTSNHREEDSSWKHSTDRATKQPKKYCCSDPEPRGLKHFHKKQATFTGEDCSPTLFSGAHMQTNAQSAVAVTPDDIINVGKQSITANFPVKKLTPLKMAIRNPLPCWNHPVSVNGKLYQRVKSPTIFKYFNHFGFSDENLLGQMTKSLDQMSIPISFPVLAGAPTWLYHYCILNGQVCQRLIHASATNLLPLVSWNLPPAAPLPMVPINHHHRESDRQSTASSPQEMKMRSTSLEKQQISSNSSPLGLSTEGQRMMDGARQKALAYKTLLIERKEWEERKLSDSRVHTSRENLSETTKAAHAQVKDNTLLAQKEDTHTSADHSTYVDATRGKTTANVDRAKECDRARDLPTQDCITNTASDNFSFQVIFQENLDALKIMDQKCQEEIALYIPGRNIDLNGGDAISQEASRTSERTWYLERKAYLQTLHQTRQNYEQNKPNEIHQDRELDARRNDATCLDRRHFKDYRYMTSPELNKMREAKEEFKASIADAYCAYLAARSAKDAAFTKMKTAVAERKALSMGILRRHESLDNPRFKKLRADADKKFVECQIENNKRFGAFNAIRHACQQKQKDRKTFEKKIEAIDRACSDAITQKTEPAMNNSVCSTFAADHDSIRVILARLEAHYTAMSALGG